MCGIIGFVGEESAWPLLLNGLRRMEYRGYDSAGMCVFNGDRIALKKGVGKVDEIHAKYDFTTLEGTIGIAHTRWATHGRVNDINAHPHLSCTGEIAVVHNGIIENHQELRGLLSREGHRFMSETDSEVIAHLLERSFKAKSDVRLSVLESVNLLKGAFAIAALFKTHPDLIVGARKDAPLAIGVGKHENFLASDVLAFIERTDRVIFLDNYEVAFLRKRGPEISRFDGGRVIKTPVQVAWEVGDITKKEFRHYTIKEIHEQLETIRRALYQEDEKLERFCNFLRTASKIYITASGTSYHAGLVAKYLLAKYDKLPCEVTLASEFSSINGLVDKESVILAISQSGETADVLYAVAAAKKNQARVVSIVNVVGASLVRESDLSLLMNCGPEIGVAATKSFTAQLAIVNLIASRLSNGNLEDTKLRDIGSKIQSALGNEKRLIEISGKYSKNPDFYFVGRGIHYPIALEGALKLKELAYIHAEGMAAGELKHGTLALIESGTPVIVLNPDDETYNDTLSNAAEMKARGAEIIGISTKISDVYDEFVRIPETHESEYPILEVIPLQMLAYYTTVEKQQNPDYPRNLAKSVTVK